METLDVLITKHDGDGKYSLTIETLGVAATLSTHGFSNRQGIDAQHDFHGVSLSDMEGIANAILAEVDAQRVKIN